MSEWISIKKKLPLYKECILFYSTDKLHGVTFGCYRGKGDDGIDWFTDYCGFTCVQDSVTHWMPLPLPPEISNE